MAPIIPAGGKKIEWIRDPEVTTKTAQGMFDDDPQLSAIKGLPNMQDGIAELEEMSTEVAPPAGEVVSECPPCDAAPAGGAVEQAIEKVKDAAQGVADAAIKEVEKVVTDAVKNVGTEAPVTEMVVEELETADKEKKEEHEKSETPAEEKKEEGEVKKDEVDVPGVEGEKDGKVEKEGDENKDEKEAFASATKGMRRLSELQAPEVAELRNYWEKLLGFPKEYVDAMLKNYKA